MLAFHSHANGYGIRLTCWSQPTRQAVTANWICLDLIGLDKLVSRIQTSVKLSVSARSSRGNLLLSKMDAGHEDPELSRNIIEEFDPGSA